MASSGVSAADAGSSANAATGVLGLRPVAEEL